MCIFISGLMTLVASRSDDQDNSFTFDDDELNFDLNQDQTLQSGYHTIVVSLADGNSRLVSEVQDFVQELRRVTLLWEELWLGSLIQIHHDFAKRETQLNDEIKRVNSSSSLSVQEKAALIKGKHIALMKPVRNQWTLCFGGLVVVCGRTVGGGGGGLRRNVSEGTLGENCFLDSMFIDATVSKEIFFLTQPQLSFEKFKPTPRNFISNQFLGQKVGKKQP